MVKASTVINGIVAEPSFVTSVAVHEHTTGSVEPWWIETWHASGDAACMAFLCSLFNAPPAHWVIGVPIPLTEEVEKRRPAR